MRILRAILSVIVVIQCALLAYGIWQIQQESQLAVSVGVFNIVLNVIFGGMNVRIIRCLP